MATITVSAIGLNGWTVININPVGGNTYNCSDLPATITINVTVAKVGCQPVVIPLSYYLDCCESGDSGSSCETPDVIITGVSCEFTGSGSSTSISSSSSASTTGCPVAAGFSECYQNNGEYGVDVTGYFDDPIDRMYVNIKDPEGIQIAIVPVNINGDTSFVPLTRTGYYSVEIEAFKDGDVYCYEYLTQIYIDMSCADTVKKVSLFDTLLNAAVDSTTTVAVTATATPSPGWTIKSADKVYTTCDELPATLSFRFVLSRAGCVDTVIFKSYYVDCCGSSSSSSSTSMSVSSSSGSCLGKILALNPYCGEFDASLRRWSVWWTPVVDMPSGWTCTGNGQQYSYATCGEVFVAESVVTFYDETGALVCSVAAEEEIVCPCDSSSSSSLSSSSYSLSSASRSLSSSSRSLSSSSYSLSSLSLSSSLSSSDSDTSSFSSSASSSSISCSNGTTLWRWLGGTWYMLENNCYDGGSPSNPPTRPGAYENEIVTLCCVECGPQADSYIQWQWQMMTNSWVLAFYHNCPIGYYPTDADKPKFSGSYDQQTAYTCPCGNISSSSSSSGASSSSSSSGGSSSIACPKGTTLWRWYGGTWYLIENNCYAGGLPPNPPTRPGAYENEMVTLCCSDSSSNSSSNSSFISSSNSSFISSSNSASSSSSASLSCSQGVATWTWNTAANQWDYQGDTCINGTTFVYPPRDGISYEEIYYTCCASSSQ